MMERLLAFVRAAVERVRNDRRRQIVLMLMAPALLLTALYGRAIFQDMWSLGALALGLALGYATRIDDELDEERRQRRADEQRSAIEVNDNES